MTPERLYDVGTVARLLHVTHQTIRNWIRAKHVRAVRHTPNGHWHIPASDVTRLQLDRKDKECKGATF